MDMEITCGTPLWIASRTILASRVDDLLKRWRKVLRTFDPEDIHDLRVSSRRLREAVSLLVPLYPERLSRVTRRVRKLTRLMGELRNTDEALIFFRKLQESLPSPARDDISIFIGHLESARELERKKLARALTKLYAPKVFRILGQPAIFPRSGLSMDPFTPLGTFAAEALVKRLEEVLALVPAALQEGAVDAQHALRIAVKRWRYRIEILSFLMGSSYEEIHGAVKAYQECLGKMHDLDVFSEMIRRQELSPAPECVILNAIGERRGEYYARFLKMVGEIPFETIGEKIGRAM